ncbi:hypothetical protein DL546_008175 [Coniochaeta pulveracea]|uniref:DNA polymerase delta subunit 3 n=2 Tax=Coniochaeta pulveracea TaxID=177199 RepID=A0A420YH79_9PEZI|nr:hypothetical protein DL546_008175 [Coniochaeta pulveracea]
MDDYKKYLAENVLSEDKVITYRYLSRALKVHVNTAKQMLYDFHKWQNEKRPGSIHAIYLIYGTKKEEQDHGSPDGDVEMSSSPPEPEFQDIVTRHTLQLVPESELTAALEIYQEVTSIHVYSLGPHPVKDMALLSDAARQVATLSSPGDTVSAKIYGTISNGNVRRRERKGAGAKLAAAVSAATKGVLKPAAPPKAVKAEPVPAAVKSKEELKPVQKAAEREVPAASGQAKKPTPTLKRGGSNIMASFAKGAAAAAKKAESRGATPSGDESSKPAMSDDDDEDDSTVLPKPKAQDAADRKSRQQRQEELRRMMEEDDDEEEIQEKGPTPEEEPVEEEPPAPEPEKEEPAEVVASSGDGRRRGKRKVMKKKQILDDQGYLVTIQEAAWESFSEDEAPQPISKPKPSTAPSASSAPAAKPKKAAGPKGSQGSIMSFFSKKT